MLVMPKSYMKIVQHQPVQLIQYTEFAKNEKEHHIMTNITNAYTK